MHFDVVLAGGYGRVAEAERHQIQHCVSEVNIERRNKLRGCLGLIPSLVQGSLILQRTQKSRMSWPEKAQVEVS